MNASVQERSRTAGGMGSGVGNGAADVEGMARRAGWVPEEDWKGDPKKWVDAETFVDRVLSGSRVADHYKQIDGRLAASEAEARTTRDQLQKVTKTLEDTTAILSEFRDYNQRVAQTAYERAKREYEAQFDRAIDDGDKAAARAAREELDRLEENKPKPAATKPDADATKKPDAAAAEAKPDPVVVEWNKENPWYVPGSPDRLTTLAMSVFHELNSDPANKGMPLREMLDKVTEEVKATFPDKFKDEPRRKPRAPAVSDSELTAGEDDGDDDKGNKSKRPRGRRWEDLPDEAKAQCRRFMEMKVKDKSGKLVPMMTREKYLDDYQWDS